MKVCIVHDYSQESKSGYCWKVLRDGQFDANAYCQMVEMELHPAGTRVVTGDALVVEKVDGEWPTSALAQSKEGE